MKVTFVANGCALYEAHDFRLVADPWLIDGAFEGSWCHYPPIRATPESLAAITDALYISHAHPDHYDERSLAAFRRDVPILVLDQQPNILTRLLVKSGFNNLLILKAGSSTRIGPFEARLFKSFDSHHFQHAALENILDSSLLLTADGASVLNLNDNIPSLSSCRTIADELPSLSLVQVQYTAASSYPSCFRNLSDAEKLKGQQSVQERYANHFGQIAKLIKPAFIMPFAGQFVIGGKEWTKNRVLGTSTPDFAASRCKEIAPDVQVVLLSEGMAFVLPAGLTEGGPYKPIDLEEQNAYIRDHLSVMPYPYESFGTPNPDTDGPVMQSLFEAAHNHLWQKQGQLKCHPDCILSVEFWDQCFECDMTDGRFWFCDTEKSVVHGSNRRSFVQVYMDTRLLGPLLRGTVHWNNAINGMHVEFFRQPEQYDPDLYMLLSYFHAPRAV